VLTVTAAALKPSDRWMADGVRYAPTEFPRLMGLDGVGRLSDGTRVAFFAPQPPYGGMAEQARSSQQPPDRGGLARGRPWRWRLAPVPIRAVGYAAAA
jgi:NADPH:quinone reductase-like Zn-dependent oxidoreductase